ncbi:energy transducer TonB [Sphingomonas sp. LT1P40]|uniref:energy transducer TonB n=1 Tax=Alteristakelama amylovorans TaxID=3096166 RepID=UPI002FCB2059
MRLDERLPDRGPGAPVRPGGGSPVLVLIALAVAVAGAGIFLIVQTEQLDQQLPKTIPQRQDVERAAERNMPLSAPATEPAGDRAQAIVSPASWVTNDDYPPAALRNGEQGSVGVEFTIKRNGRVADCRIAHSSGSPLLDRTTCALITERALYSPAVDAQGRAIDQTSRLRFRWQIQE